MLVDPKSQTRAGDAGRQSALPGLQRAEALALATLDANIVAPADALSGHDLRHCLRRLGMPKVEATLAVQALVGHGLVARVRRDDADDRFFTAYQLTERGTQWVREHGDMT